MNTQQKQDFARLVKRFGAEKANELHNTFMRDTKRLFVAAHKKGEGVKYVEDVEPSMFHVFVNDITGIQIIYKV